MMYMIKHEPKQLPYVDYYLHNSDKLSGKDCLINS